MTTNPLRLGLALLLILTPAWADAPKALPEGKKSNDVRLQPLKDLDGYFPFAVPASKDAWNARRKDVKLQVQAALGLYPLPEKTPLNAVVHGKIELDDYTVEKVIFESWPGFYVTGSLYRPKNLSGKAPGILCPHGHWENGRFLEESDASADKAVASGAELFRCAGKSPLQARCVQLARMGCVVFHYDMLGNADSIQISQKLTHGFAKQRPEMNDSKNWGLYSPPAEGRLQSIMGLQAWNSIRSLDFITSLADVDPARIGVTGASGGGTQTFILGAIDDRPAAIVPAVMVSTAMQGGCTCENCSLLRVGTGNVEIAGVFAPKPMAMTSANDWTKEMETKGYPELKKLYEIMGAPDKVHLTALTQFPHNYNHPSGKAVYAWFAKHLMGGKEPPPEREFKFLTAKEMTVWDDKHPKPAADDPAFERSLLKAWDAANQKALAATPGSTEQGIKIILGRTLETAGKTSFDMSGGKQDRGAWLEMTGVVKNETHGEEIPATFLHPKNWNGKVALFLTDRGKSGLFEGDQPSKAVNQLLQAGIGVCGADLLGQGELLIDGKPVEKTRKVKNPREAPAYTFGYNHTLFAQRTHDVLTLIRFMQTDNHAAKGIAVAAFGGTGPVAAAASSQFGAAVQTVAADTGDFSFSAVSDAFDPNFLPGAIKYGGLPAMQALFKGKTVDLKAVAGEKELAAAKAIAGQ